MEEIIKLVAQKAGISPSVAQIAVSTALSAVKNKLPGDVGCLLDSFIGSDSGSAAEPLGKITKTSRKTKSSSDTLGTIGNIISGLSKVFGRK